MKVKTADLTDLALDWAVAVAVAEGLGPVMRHNYMRAKAAANNYKGDLAWHLEVTPNEPITVDEAGVTHVLRAYSEQWSQGGPIIEQGEIELLKWSLDGWAARDTNYQFLNTPQERPYFAEGYGPTPLIAAMRCFVASLLGDEVDIPEELLK